MVQLKAYFLIMVKKSSMGVAGMLVIWTVPRAPNSRETRIMTSLFGASTMRALNSVDVD